MEEREGKRRMHEKRGQMQISKEVVGSVHGCGTFGSTGDNNLTCGQEVLGG